MSDEYYPFYTTMLHDNKVWRLAERLDIPYYAASGLLALFWAWTKRSGDDLTDVSPLALASAMQWPQDRAGALHRALIDTEFIDQDGETLTVHGFDERNGEAEAAKIARKHSTAMGQPGRASKKTIILDRDGWVCRFCGNVIPEKSRRGDNVSSWAKLDPKGDYIPNNVVHTCRSCALAHAGKTTEQSGLILRPAPNPTDEGQKGQKPVILPSSICQTTRDERKESVSSSVARDAHADEAREIAEVLRYEASDEFVAEVGTILAAHPETDGVLVATEFVEWQDGLPEKSAKRRRDWLEGFRWFMGLKTAQGKCSRRANRLRLVKSDELVLPTSGSDAWNKTLAFIYAENTDAIALAREEKKTSRFEQLYLSLQVTEDQYEITLAAPDEETKARLMKDDSIIRSCLRVAGYGHLTPAYGVQAQAVTA